ncbi:DUF2752 domain-containing protein [Algibacter mikhailovii]|uniref:DUF2752 domain-containing protein n=1 Tax=Algibacter mikhailovii TaxID=425498 RepID=A0A918VC33_9FLAO|nr:DUF2752 domain-containing protein [Algibacter mikhailovii]GGZ86824.1 hypothetical protein GCM10007028_26150 [Algibacter mikhailovii]
MEEFMLPCLNKKLLGFECFGCGIQRSIALILEGEFVGAFHMYPAIYSLTVLFVLILINYFQNFKWGSKIITILAILNAVIIVTSFFIKNFIIN